MSAITEMIQLTESSEQLEHLITDVFTEAELEMIEERFHILHHLHQGLSQRAVKEELGIGIATVTRGAKVLKYGSGVVQKLLEKTTYFKTHGFKKYLSNN